MQSIKLAHYVLLVLAVFTFSGCQEKEALEEYKPFAIRAELISCLSPEEQQEKYGELTPQEKAEVWQDKLQQSIQVGDWTKEQSAFLNEVYTSLTPSIFKYGTPESQVYFSTDAKEHQKQAKLLFDYQVIRQIATQVEDYNK